MNDRIIVVLLAVLFFVVLIGCRNKIDNTVPPSFVLTEQSDGGTYKINKTGTFIVELTKDANDADSYWGYPSPTGGLVVLSEDYQTRGKDKFIIQANGSGKIAFMYIKFTDTGVKTLKTVNFEILTN